MISDDTIRLKVGFHAEPDFEDVIDTGITRADWDTMTQKQRDAVCNEHATELRNERAYAWAKPTEPDGR